MNNIHKIDSNIYITSDEEINNSIKPCWCVNTVKNTWNDDLIYYQGSMPLYHYKGFKKIILTTDQNLIKDGVQAIDDEFLEWFVKNPTCEYVEVQESSYQKKLKKPIHKGLGVYRNDETIYFLKIIIPQEEPKQEDEIIDISDHDGIGNAIDNLNNEEPEKETIEEAAEKYVRNEHDDTLKLISKYSFKDGAKWQQEQILQFLYSEITERRPYSPSRMCEEVIKFIEQRDRINLDED